MITIQISRDESILESRMSWSKDLIDWQTIQVSPMKLYEMLSNVTGDKYFRI